MMHLIFRKEEGDRVKAAASTTQSEETRPLWQNAVFFLVLVGILVTATWGGCNCAENLTKSQYFIKNIILLFFSISLCIILVVLFKIQWWKVLIAAIVVAASIYLFPGRFLLQFGLGITGLSIITATSKGEASDWFTSTFIFTKQILPLLFIGVLIAGSLLGRPTQEGIIPSQWVAIAVGGNSIWANLFASVAGAFMYFATLTEVPILQGLIGSGMGKGPALALLLAGPALSLPNMLVINSIMGIKRTLVFILLVVVMATFSGIIYGAVF
jgi:uncharacterized membrane protein YraQ (UPF0718 family)